MTGWSVLNVAIDADSPVRAATVQETAHEHLGKSVTSALYHGTVVVRLSGYRDWSTDERFVGRLHPEAWTRCVIVQANDTVDVGTARLYEQTDDGGLKVVDKYVESGAGGDHVGDLAAASLYATHHIPCLGNLRYPLDVTRHTDAAPGGES